MTVRAVIFDLWETLVDWPAEEARSLSEKLADRLGLTPGELEDRVRESYLLSQTKPLATLYRALGVPDEHIETHVTARFDFARRALRPRPGVVNTLVELRARGVKLGLISMCSEDVPAAWPETELAGLFDAETFSCATGLVKPKPEIYLHTSRGLDVDPGDCLFVGDGANDELAGAERVGMTPVLLAAGNGEPTWSEVRDWRGLRISSIPQVLELV
jgi:putative hydrolase of the HAD superfamily